MSGDDQFDDRLRELLAAPGPDDDAFVRRIMATLAAERAHARRRATMLGIAALLATMLAFGFAGPALSHPAVLAAALLLTTSCALAWLFTDAPALPRG